MTAMDNGRIQSLTHLFNAVIVADGYYLYLDSYRVGKAQLYSPVLNIKWPGACLSFWFHMFGDDVNRLQVWRYKHM